MMTMSLQEKYFNLIKTGEKVYEIRLNDEKRQKLDVGDVVRFVSDNNAKQHIDLVVKDLIYFDSFSEMLKTLPLKKLGFANETESEVHKIYRQFYPEELEQKYKILAIKI